MTITIPIADYEPVIIEERDQVTCVTLQIGDSLVYLNDYEVEQVIAGLKAVRRKPTGAPALPVH